MDWKQRIAKQFSTNKAFNRLIEQKSVADNIKKAMVELETELHQRGVTLCFFEVPRKDRIRNLTPFEKRRIKKWTFDFNKIQQDWDLLRKIYGPNVEKNYLQRVNEGVCIANLYGRKALLGFSSKEVNFYNGTRLTIGQPPVCPNTIYMFGACLTRGVGVEDAHTISSFLQDNINRWKPNRYRVENKGIGFGSTVLDDIRHIHEQTFIPGDVVIILNYVSVDFLKDHVLKNQYECSSLFDRPNGLNEWFIDDPQHTLPNANQKIADYMFHTLNENNLITQASEFTTQKTAGTPRTKEDFMVIAKTPEFENYMSFLQKYISTEATIGCIIMNCNPFTLGHLYLIETSAAKVDRLYIFVVEEDKSFFPFKDRLELVKLGVRSLNNVTVLPSGRFIVSALTFPGYFVKEDQKDLIVDSSHDIDLFALFIAPVLNIKIRFVGEEPVDMVTRQYNDTMRNRLPLYGVGFDEIPRKHQGEHVISASRVRALLKEQNFEAIKNLVPPTTMEYIIKNFGEGRNDVS